MQNMTPHALNGRKIRGALAAFKGNIHILNKNIYVPELSYLTTIILYKLKEAI
jgi:hypothetical protein